MAKLLVITCLAFGAVVAPAAGYSLARTTYGGLLPPVSYAERQQIGLADRYASVSMSDLFSNVKVDIRSAAYASRQEELDVYARGAFSKVMDFLVKSKGGRYSLFDIASDRVDFRSSVVVSREQVASALYQKFYDVFLDQLRLEKIQSSSVVSAQQQLELLENFVGRAASLDVVTAAAVAESDEQFRQSLGTKNPLKVIADAFTGFPLRSPQTVYEGYLPLNEVSSRLAPLSGGVVQRFRTALDDFQSKLRLVPTVIVRARDPFRQAIDALGQMREISVFTQQVSSLQSCRNAFVNLASPVDAYEAAVSTLISEISEVTTVLRSDYDLQTLSGEQARTVQSVFASFQQKFQVFEEAHVTVGRSVEDVVVSINQFEEVYQVVDKTSVEIRDVAGYVRSAFSQFSESLTTFRRVYTEVDVRVVSVRSALKDCGSISVLRNVIQTTERTTQTGAYSVYTNARGLPAVRDYVDYSNYQDYRNYQDSAVVRDGALLQDVRGIGRDFRLRPYVSLPNVGIYRDVLASPEVRVSRLSLPYTSPRVFGDYVAGALKPAVQAADSQVLKAETSISSQTGSTVPASGEVVPQSENVLKELFNRLDSSVRALEGAQPFSPLTLDGQKYGVVFNAFVDFLNLLKRNENSLAIVVPQVKTQTQVERLQTWLDEQKERLSRLADGVIVGRSAQEVSADAVSAVRQTDVSLNPLSSLFQQERLQKYFFLFELFGQQVKEQVQLAVRRAQEAERLAVFKEFVRTIEQVRDIKTRYEAFKTQLSDTIVAQRYQEFLRFAQVSGFNSDVILSTEVQRLNSPYRFLDVPRYNYGPVDTYQRFYRVQPAW